MLIAEYVSAGGVPGAGAELLEQGAAMRDALRADLAALPGAAPELLQPRPGEAVEAALRRVQHAYRRVWVVAPESDGALLACCDAVDARRWIGCTRDAIALAGSKRATLGHLAAHALPTPLQQAAAARRWVVKPDDGAGACDTRVWPDRARAAADAATRPVPAVLEPWVDGEALSLSLLCGGAGRGVELLAVNRQWIEVDSGGLLHYAGVEAAAVGAGDARWPVLRGLARRIAAVLPGLRGYAGVDLVWHPQAGPVVIEVNPRLTCAYVGLSARLGRRLGAEILALHGNG